MIDLAETLSGRRRRRRQEGSIHVSSWRGSSFFVFSPPRDRASLHRRGPTSITCMFPACCTPVLSQPARTRGPIRSRRTPRAMPGVVSVFTAAASPTGRCLQPIGRRHHPRVRPVGTDRVRSLGPRSRRRGTRVPSRGCVRVIDATYAPSALVSIADAPTWKPPVFEARAPPSCTRFVGYGTSSLVRSAATHGSRTRFACTHDQRAMEHEPLRDYRRPPFSFLITRHIRTARAALAQCSRSRAQGAMMCRDSWLVRQRHTSREDFAVAAAVLSRPSGSGSRSLEN